MSIDIRLLTNAVLGLAIGDDFGMPCMTPVPGRWIKQIARWEGIVRMCEDCIRILDKKY